MLTIHRSDRRRQVLAGCVAGALALAATGLFQDRPAVAAEAVQAPADSCNLTAPGRIVAIGDVHGAFDRYLAILREAKLIDAQKKWIGGNTILVHTGDLIDRGDDSRKVLNFVRELEVDAAKGGGQVRFLLGNHEVMRMAGDWRYVTRPDVESYRNAQSDATREELYAKVVKVKQSDAKMTGQKFNEKDFRKEFLEKTPLGAVEMEKAFSTTGEYGGWLRQHDIMARINNIIFVHAGPGRKFADMGCAGINAEAREEMKDLNLAAPNILDRMLWNGDGPLWYRGLVGVEPVATPDDVTAILKALGGTKMVVGHTASRPGKIRVMQDGRLFAIDSGMLGGEMFVDGVASALDIDKGTFTAIYEGKREVLMQDAGKLAASAARR